MVMVAVRGGCVCVGGWVGGWVGGERGVRRYFQHNRGGLELFCCCFGAGYCLRFCKITLVFQPHPDNYCAVP